MSTYSAVVKLVNNVSAPAKNISGSINNMTRNIKGAMGSVANLKNAIGGALAVMAVDKIIDFGKELHNAYETQRKAEQAVNDSIYSNLKARGESQEVIDKEVNAYKSLASELQSVGVIGDEVTLSGMAVMTQMNLTADQVKELTPLVQDLAVKQNGVNVSQEQFKDVSKEVANMVNMGKISLQKYGIQITDTERKSFKAMSAQERYAFIVKKLNDNVKGVNKSLAKTPEGKIARVNNEIGDIKEQLGQQLDLLIEPMLDPILKAVKWLNSDFQSAIDSIKQKGVDIYNKYKPYFDVFNDIIRVWKGAFNGFLPYVDNILDGLGTAIGGAFKFIMSLVKGDFSGMWDGLKELISGVCDAISNYVRGMSNAVVNAFAEMIGQGEEWEKIQKRLKENTNGAGYAKLVEKSNMSNSDYGAKPDNNATGTNYFKGGLTHINENNRGEVVNLPSGTQIIPHDVAVKQQQGATYNVTVNVQGNVIGNDDYVNSIGDSIVQRLQLSMNNM